MIDARSLADRITSDASSAENGDSTKLQADANELQHNPKTWRDVDLLIQDHNNHAAKDHLPTVTITHEDGQTQIAETPYSDSMTTRVNGDVTIFSGMTTMGALLGSTIGPEGTIIGAGIGAVVGAAVVAGKEVSHAMSESASVSSK